MNDLSLDEVLEGDYLRFLLGRQRTSLPEIWVLTPKRVDPASVNWDRPDVIYMTRKQVERRE